LAGRLRDGADHGGRAYRDDCLREGDVLLAIDGEYALTIRRNGEVALRNQYSIGYMPEMQGRQQNSGDGGYRKIKL
jgi:hypothetical protein